MVLSVIIGEETEVVGVRACLTWKPLSVLTLMGRMKRGRVKALSLPPAPPGLRHSPGLEHSRIAKWGLDTPPPPNPYPDPSILGQLFLIKPPTPTPPACLLSLSLPKPPHYHPQPSVPFSSNRAVWPSSPAFNLPSRSGAEANKAPG